MWIRPKSMATVVAVLVAIPPRSSIPMERSVMAASVASGSISEMAPMKVVLPTEKPPATTIFKGMVVMSELIDAMENLLEEGAVFGGARVGDGRSVEFDEVGHDEV